MQVLHLGYWKTATTGIQQLILKPDASRPYYGVNGDQTDAWRRDWLMRLASKSLDADWAKRSFVYSDESALVRIGGRQGLSRVAVAIRETFNDPHVLLTIRDPADLLISAYFQSVAVRRRAVGAGDGGTSYRFVKFPDWWREMHAAESTTLAGLLNFAAVRDEIAQLLGPSRVHLFSLELIRHQPDSFRSLMESLGCQPTLISDFLNHPKVNSTTRRLLRRSCGPLMNLGKTPQAFDNPALERLVYLGSEIDVAERYPDVVAEIRKTYSYDPKTLSEEFRLPVDTA